MVYDVTDERSFNSRFPALEPGRGPAAAGTVALTEVYATDIRTWFANVEQHATEGVNKILIGNKCDWEEKRQVSTERGQALADELGIPFMEVSAKSNINVEKAFYTLAADIKKRIIDTARTDGAPQGPNNAGRVGIADGSGGGMGGMGGKCC